MPPIFLLILSIFFFLVFLIAFFWERLFRNRPRRFEKGVVFTWLSSLFWKPDKLIQVNNNLDQLKEIKAKVENKDLPRMAQELKKAEDEYKEAIKICNGSKAAERAVKDAYDTRCSRIKDKYNA